MKGKDLREQATVENPIRIHANQVKGRAFGDP